MRGRSRASRTPKLAPPAADALPEYPVQAADASAIGTPEPSFLPLVQFGTEIFGFLQEGGDFGDGGGGRIRIVCMRRPRANVAEMPPGRPLRSQQALSVAGADELGKRHARRFLRRGRPLLQVSPQCLVSHLV